MVSPVCSRKSWTLDTTMVTGSPPHADGYPPHPPHPTTTTHHANLTRCDTRHKRSATPTSQAEILPFSLRSQLVGCSCNFCLLPDFCAQSLASLFLIISELPYRPRSSTTQSGLMFLMDNHNRQPPSPSPPPPLLHSLHPGLIPSLYPFSASLFPLPLLF